MSQGGPIPPHYLLLVVASVALPLSAQQIQVTPGSLSFTAQVGGPAPTPCRWLSSSPVSYGIAEAGKRVKICNGDGRLPSFSGIISSPVIGGRTTRPHRVYR